MNLFNKDRIRKDYLLHKINKQFKIVRIDNKYYSEAWNEALCKIIDIIEKSKN